MTYARRPARRAALRSRRLNSPHRDRRVLFAEQLEGRALMAADVMVSDFWNASRPADVNADGAVAPLDALLIVNELNSYGTRSVMGPQAGGGGGEGESPSVNRYYRDVNNDGMISPLDALIVFNELNGEGESPLIQYQIHVLPVNGAPYTEDPVTFEPVIAPNLTSIPKGTDYDLVVTVRDLRGPGNNGVFSGYLDVNYESSLTRVKVSEVQHIVIAAGTATGTFRLTFNGQTTGNIGFNPAGNPLSIATAIQTALTGLSSIGAGNVAVTYDPIPEIPGPPVVPGVPNRWAVQFRGALLDQDVNPITISGGTANPISAANMQIVETAQGVATDPAAFREAFRSRLIPGVTDIVYYVNGLNAGNFDDRIDDVGAIATGSSPFPQTNPVELVRARMTATNAGSFVFSPDVTQILNNPPGAAGVTSPAHPSLLYGSNVALTTMELNAGTSVPLTITADVLATADTINITENSTGTSGISFNPLIAGGNPAAVNPPPAVGAQAGILADQNNTGAGTLEVRSFTPAANGTVSRVGNVFTYLPNANFFGQDTFTYTIGIGPSGGATDTATVTVNVAGVNNAPTITVAGAATKTTLEDTALAFSGADLITVSDIDAGTSNVQVTLNATNGTLTLSNIAGLGFTTGDGTADASMSFTGTLTAINAALNGSTFNPTPNATGSASVSINVNDLGSTGDGTLVPLQANATIPITITAVNDAPINSVPGAQSVDEGQSLTFNLTNGNLISVSDVDSTSGRVSLSVGDGTLTLSTIAGLTFVSGDGTADASMVFSGTFTAINAALDGMTYAAPAITNGLTTLTIISNDQTDGSGLSDTDTVSIDVLPTVRPRARNDNPSIPVAVPPVAGSYRINVLQNDVGNISTGTSTFPVTLEEFPATIAEGTLVRFENGTPADLTDDQIDFIPTDPKFLGTITFQYGIWDTSGTMKPAPLPANAVATVTLTITNAAPVANPDTYTPIEDIQLVVLAANGVLFNDSDLETPKADLTAVKVTDPTHGTVVLAADGSFVYTPTNLHFNGTDSFTYKTNDGFVDSAVTTVTFNYIADNDAPVAVADEYTTSEDTLLSITTVPLGLLKNDTDVENSPLTVVLPLASPPAGTLNLNANGTFTYQPVADFVGDVTFQYTVSDGSKTSAPATVTIHVVEFDDPPVTTNFSATTSEDTTFDIDAAVAPNTIDPDSAVITLIQPGSAGSGTTGPSHGTVTIVGNKYRYTPANNFFGTDSFTYRVTDQVQDPLRSNISTISITINEVNDAPIANPDGTPTPILAVKNFIDQPISVLGNDTDPDNSDSSNTAAAALTNDDVLRVFSVNGSTSGPVATAHGTVKIVGTGVNAQIQYTPTAGYTGPDSFQYVVSDGRTVGLGPVPGLSSPATVTLNVVDFVPKTVSGVVFVDGNANGVFDFTDTNNSGDFDPGEPSERTLQGVTVHLSGLSFQDVAVSIDAVSDADGRYSFPGLTPPKANTDYIVTEIQPLYLVDGADSPRDINDSALNPVSGLVFDNGNDSFRLRWDIVDQNGNITLRFGERGIDAAAINANGGDSRGLLTDLLASSGGNGLVLTADSAGNFIWSWTLPGWENAKTLKITLDANLASATLSGTDQLGNPFSIRIHQDPRLNTEANYPSGATSPYGPRFRILGRSGTNDYIIRLDGTAAEFGLNLLAAVAPAAPVEEGEGEGNVDREFARAADEVFSGEAWA